MLIKHLFLLFLITKARCDGVGLNNEKITTSETNEGETKAHRARRQTNEVRYESFAPCADGFITLDRFIGLPYEEENYYNGTAYLEKFRKYLPHADIDIVLDAPATISVDPKLARVHLIRTENRRFSIRTHELPSAINFTIRSASLKPFPHLLSVELSGKVVCPNPKKWVPTLLGAPDIETEVGNRIFIPSDEVAQDCGQRLLDGVAFVTHSTGSEPGDWPWHVAVYKTQPTKKYRCGGNIISTTSVLTVAHCTIEAYRPIPASVLTVVVGKYHLSQQDSTSKDYQVSRVIVHNRFNPRQMKNDIALLRLAENITYNDYVQPVCLWNFRQIAKNFLYGQKGTLIGWGSTEPKSSLSETLRSGQLTLVSDTTCLLSYSDFFERFLTDDTFCAGTGAPNGTSPCNGDSGGGLVFDLSQKAGAPVWYLRGLVSVSVPLNGSCDPNHYTVFTDSVRYLSWIHANWL